MKNINIMKEDKVIITEQIVDNNKVIDIELLGETR